ncbi:MAG: efflux transporter outer membrane subunit [Proteobacteria bacterium]|nr:efflux transporter outer membrane subunit [Pseudomonadota bacterium]
MRRLIKSGACIGLVALLSACASVGPDFVKQETELPPGWSQAAEYELDSSAISQPQWWRVFDDPVLNRLVELAWEQNNSLEVAGLRVLESRAQLGIAQGNQYPQSQLAAGNGTYTSPANNAGGGSNFWTYGIGASASWEIDFWGRFRRGIESADAAYLSSIAARDQALILLTAQLVNTYTAIRINEEQLRISHENIKIQQRSYDITSVLFRNGSDSELDMQQAHTLLLSTQASIPGFEIALKQALNALNTLLGKTRGTYDAMLAEDLGIPTLPENIEVGIPADLLRRRPDVRQAELNALAQNARVGFAQADLYPSFSITGSLGLVAGGAGGTDFGDLFSSDALTFSIGPSFVWPFLNYGRIRNNVRVQDARLQQALVNYREVVLQSAREVEDAMIAFNGSQKQVEILDKTVISAKRSNELSVLRYREGFSDYQRVLDSQQALFSQQQRLVTQRGTSVSSLVALYRALGGGWENQTDLPLVSEQSRELMEARTNWGKLLEEDIPVKANDEADHETPEGE